MNSQICEFSTTTKEGAKTKGRKITWAGYCCCADAWCACSRFESISDGRCCCSPAFSSAHGCYRLLQRQGEKLLTRATGDIRLRGKKVRRSERAFQNRTDGRNWPGAVWSGSNLWRKIRPGVYHCSSSKPWRSVISMVATAYPVDRVRVARNGAQNGFATLV